MKLVSDITDNELQFATQKFKAKDPIWRIEIIQINRFG